MLFADCGTTYTKIMDSKTHELQIVQTRNILRKKPLIFDAATGHLGRNRTDFYRNELICLARGARKMIGSDTFCIVDIGGRDTKLVEFSKGIPVRLDWNTSCGANTGFTLEIVGEYFGVDFATLKPDKEHINVTCGVFGIERIFDSIIDGVQPGVAVSRFVHGIALSIHKLVDRRDSFYLSGGLTQNECFMRSLGKYAEIISLGRTVLIEGLIECYDKESSV